MGAAMDSSHHKDFLFGNTDPLPRLPGTSSPSIVPRLALVLMNTITSKELKLQDQPSISLEDVQVDCATLAGRALPDKMAWSSSFANCYAHD